LRHNGLAVLPAMVFDFLVYTSRQPDPAIATIARKATSRVRGAARRLANLNAARVLNCLRRRPASTPNFTPAIASGGLIA
jgi:hypothetical protein